MEGTIYTLQQLLLGVRDAIDNAFPVSVWVKGEIASCSVNRSGHCYMNLIEKNILTGALLAEVRAIIWSSRYRSLATRFASETGRNIEDGMNILALATVQYSELYGLSLIIEDIDPSFTAGEAFLERQRTIDRLTEEGMMDLNAQHQMPALPRRLAVISAATAAGYGDFMEHLHGNPYGFRFYSELFTAPMQGAEAPAGIISALEKVAERAGDFDAVLILRGGGSATDSIMLNTDGTPATKNNVALGKNHVKCIVDMMAERNIPPYVNDDYVAIAHPTTFRQLKNDLEQLHQYVETGFRMILNGEIGRYEGVRFVEQTSIPKETWENNKSNWAFFFGDDTVAEAIAVPEEIRGKIPTDYGRSRGVAWYYLGGFGIVHPRNDADGSMNARIVKWGSQES